MNISIVGTGYVGLVTGVGLAEIGHHVTCIDINEEKIRKLKKGISPIYEPGIESLILKNISKERLDFTTSFDEGIRFADTIYLAVGTPTGIDGEIDMTSFDKASNEIVDSINGPTIIVIKSTVPVGTNNSLQKMMNERAQHKVTVVSNPEFLREGRALSDLFEGDRIIIGSEDKEAIKTMERINTPFDIPMVITSPKSAELIKYASNAFLATKISFINEIANLCDLVGADIQEVSFGMGLDKRIGSQFLQAGTGYGGSCFPKDTLGLLQIAKESGMKFQLLQEVIKTNSKQQKILVKKLLTKMDTINGKKIAILGVAFKPNTDDIREAPALRIIEELSNQGALVYAYDPIVEKSNKALPQNIRMVDMIEEALNQADAALIVTEWEEIKKLKAEDFKKWMKCPIIVDGRNCFDPNEMVQLGIYYQSIGRGGEKKSLVLK
ncbi:UDP-glucose dehydrogenase family protein [Listeria kieliensis]|uniref:UDP-glucose 6-dehydrogenase n=1 Tax=Listeria kieliensis TaxID=1621700 RepID=A0A3D8TNQ8_9LIST|nr:UDP-glucose/GDP-mannose dehydrogenase family protein [Listeria kieliensis]RDW99445.1 UDP-glucose 6-dehydrogenase [Listeria kieliensis]